MKKKYYWMVGIMCLMLGLTACKKPADALPEVSSDNWIESYDKSSKSYGNDVVDEIIASIKKDKNFVFDKLEGFEIYSRVDSQTKEQKSNIYVYVTARGEYVDYVVPYLVELDYNKSSKKWEVGEINIDDDEDFEMEVREDLSEEQLARCMEYTYINFDNWDYIHVYESGIIELNIDSVKYKVNKKNVIECTYSCTMTYQDGLTVYEVEFDFPVCLTTLLSRDEEEMYILDDYFDYIDGIKGNIISETVDNSKIDEFEGSIDIETIVSEMVKDGYTYINSYDYYDSLEKDMIVYSELGEVNYESEYDEMSVEVVIGIASDSGVISYIPYTCYYYYSEYDREWFYSYSIMNSWEGTIEVSDEFSGVLEGDVERNGGSLRITIAEIDDLDSGEIVELDATLEYSANGKFTDTVTYQPYACLECYETCLYFYFDYTYPVELTALDEELTELYLYWDYDNECWVTDNYSDITIELERVN